ncbi:MFS transporter [Sutterella sp.]|uniref:MFS transporter n=1 Tax=Sutterella sp. TaxID=1981025 RepID=UPI0026DFAC57|nr:MFS transporter [Sutterella sp.]MDO5532289.1 MFS transporter [Sutterella sp.]
MIEVLSPDGKRWAGSAPAGTPVLAGSEVSELRDEVRYSGRWADIADSVSGATKGTYKLVISLIRAPWLEHLRVNVFDMLTLTVVALLFMTELFLLLMRLPPLLEKLRGRTKELDSLSSSNLFRPMGFFLCFATDMSISFVPLRMAELVPADAASRDMLLGLPISAELAMTGLCAFVAGTWMKRSGARLPLVAGFLLIAIGMLCCNLAVAPWQYIVARGMCGAGYGLCILTMQACTVRESKIADMFAGVYAGSLCGCAVGAMAAERLGFAPVFLFAVVVAVLLAFVPPLFLTNRPLDQRTGGGAAAPRMTLRELFGAVGERRFILFCLLALMPTAMLAVAFLNYFMPLYLDGAHVAQSDIGRVYMLNCLVIIWSSPLFAKFTSATSVKKLPAALAILLCAAALYPLGLFPSVIAAVVAAVMLGLSMGLCIPALTEYLMGLNIVKVLGVDQSMSLFDAMQRFAQVIAPLAAGAALAVMSVPQISWVVGTAYVAAAVLFFITSRSAKSKASAESDNA